MSSDGTVAFRHAAAALNEAADKDLRTEVYAAFRRAVRPLGEKVIREGSAEMPHRGGLSKRVAGSKIGQSNSTTGRNPGVTMSIRSVQGYNLKAMDGGVLRHPVFARPGRPRVWRVQSIRAGAFTRPFEAGAPEVRRQVIDALEAVNDRIVRESNRGGL